MSSVAVTVRSLAGDAAAVVKGAAVERNVLRLKHELVDLTGALENYGKYGWWLTYPEKHESIGMMTFPSQMEK